jgi:threonine dehydrogenase-like Zn-dependent dehydrogenase
MKALVYRGPRNICYESVEDPRIEAKTDAIIKVDKCAICGSDLHIFHGHGFSDDVGFCVGHEAVGEVVEVGTSVRRIKVGDKVMLSGAVGCGSCIACLSGNVTRCENGGPSCYGLSNQLQGCQAEGIRVPMADFNAAPIPEGVSPNQALMLTDNLPTAWFGCVNADIKPGKTVAIIGLGPIGLMAVECAFVLGASTVYAIDIVPERRSRAAQLGAIPVNGSDPVEFIRDATNNRLLDCVVEAAGSDATIDMALKLAGAGGNVSVVGVSHAKDFAFPMRRAFFKGLTFRIGMCSVQSHWPELVPLIRSGRIRPEQFVSHELSLSAGPDAYRALDLREQGVLKSVLAP